MHAIPRVERHMSLCPFTIGEEQPLIHAHLLMREHKVRHLPVLREGKLAGVVSEHDLHLREVLSGGGDPEEIRVADAMSTDVYAVSPDTPLDEVVHEMAVHKYGCTVVIDHGKVVGIFTSVDAMEAFASALAS